jgi:hypothetical protein
MRGRATTRGLAIGIAVGVASGASCISPGAFACNDDAECGADGICEESGYCSSPDADCPSGRRWSRYSPSDLAGRCVEDDTGTSTSTSVATTDDGADTTTDGGSSGPPVHETEDGSTGDSGPASACVPDGRDPTPPVLLYDFCEGQGTSVESITEVKLELVFENGSIGDGFEWVDDGLLLDGDTTDAHTALRSFEPTFERLESCRESGEFTLEVWATPLFDSQGGPTGIVTIGDPIDPDVDAGVFMNPEWEDPGYVATLRTTDDESRMEWLGTPYLQPNHLVLVREAGSTTLYLGGEVLVTTAQAGDLSEWNPNFDVVLGNLSYYDVRNWQGTFHLVAIYCEALSPAQILANYDAGHRPK